MEHPIQSVIKGLSVKSIKQFRLGVKEIQGDGVIEIPVEVLRELVEQRGLVKLEIKGKVKFTLVP